MPAQLRTIPCRVCKGEISRLVFRFSESDACCHTCYTGLWRDAMRVAKHLASTNEISLVTRKQMSLNAAFLKGVTDLSKPCANSDGVCSKTNIGVRSRRCTRCRTKETITLLPSLAFRLFYRALKVATMNKLPGGLDVEPDELDPPVQHARRASSRDSPPDDSDSGRRGGSHHAAGAGAGARAHQHQHHLHPHHPHHPHESMGMPPGHVLGGPDHAAAAAAMAYGSPVFTFPPTCMFPAGPTMMSHTPMSGYPDPSSQHGSARSFSQTSGSLPSLSSSEGRTPASGTGAGAGAGQDAGHPSQSGGGSAQSSPYSQGMPGMQALPPGYPGGPMLYYPMGHAAYPQGYPGMPGGMPGTLQGAGNYNYPPAGGMAYQHVPLDVMFPGGMGVPNQLMYANQGQMGQMGQMGYLNPMMFQMHANAHAAMSSGASSQNGAARASSQPSSNKPASGPSSSQPGAGHTGTAAFAAQAAAAAAPATQPTPTQPQPDSSADPTL